MLEQPQALFLAISRMGHCRHLLRRVVAVVAVEAVEVEEVEEVEGVLEAAETLSRIQGTSSEAAAGMVEEVGVVMGAAVSRSGLEAARLG